MKGIGPNNLGMSKMAGSDCCGIPNCGCGDSAAKFNDELKSAVASGKIKGKFAKAISAAPLKKKGCKGYQYGF